MNILLISASPRKEKSQTFILAKEVLRGCSQATVKSDIIHLRDIEINFCRHCEQCHKKIMHCSISDSVPPVIKKMLEADGIILATPNYINQVTASMKALFERSAHFIHCKRLLGKYVVCVVSSGSGQDKDVLDYVKFYAHTCGAQYSGGVSSRVPISKEKMQEAHELGKRLALDIEDKRAYPDQIEIIEKGKQHFKEIIRLRQNEWKEEYQYWLDKGWL